MLPRREAWHLGLGLHGCQLFTRGRAETLPHGRAQPGGVGGAGEGLAQERGLRLGYAHGGFIDACLCAELGYAGLAVALAVVEAHDRYTLDGGERFLGHIGYLLA